MSIHSGLRKLRAVSFNSFPRSAFFAMFIGVVIAPLVALAAIGSNPHIPGWYNLAWLILAVALLLFAGVGGGFLLFRRAAYIGKGLSVGRA
jgi:hypothetical protein